jgi:hypothetical protein
MRLAEARLLTALAVIGLCGLAIFRGWDIVRFSHARAGLASHEHRADAVRRWMATPGLAATALEVPLTDPVGPMDGARKRGDELTAILSVRPLSSMKWLSLASVRLITGQPFDKALALSWLTGPNEGYVMSQRGIFGLLQWEDLPSDAHKRVVRDFAGAILGDSMSVQEAGATTAVLATKSAETRREITELLRSEGISTAELARIGF